MHRAASRREAAAPRRIDFIYKTKVRGEGNSGAVTALRFL
jgi:hypothetical protein